MTTSRTTHLDKGVDGEDDELGLCFGIVHEIQIDQLLLLQVVGLLLVSPVSLLVVFHHEIHTMFLTTSGNSPLQSLPIVWFAITRLMASARLSLYSLLSCWRSSQFSPVCQLVALEDFCSLQREVVRRYYLPFRGGATAMTDVYRCWCGKVCVFGRLIVG